ncbi:hypothetical protein NKDENANG_03314 [Candidatus Entotheonellaceae bacterium PAL068K]
MAETEGISIDNLRVLVERAGLGMSEAELEALKPMYDLYARQVHRLHDVELGAEEVAVRFSPHWEPCR